MAKSMRLGGGGRAEAMVAALSHKPGIRNPGAVMAAHGMRRYGKERFLAMAAAGRRRAARRRHASR